jgi:hypothetical protein
MNSRRDSAMQPKDPEGTENQQPSHLDEYKALHDEITMCQHEMHRTWLWASIAAGAVYTWLPSHRSDINSIHSSWLVWYIPPFLLIFCFIRYIVFWFRIRSLADYQCRIEKHAFREEKGSSTFSVDDFVDLPSLASKLWQPKRAVDTWLADHLSPATKTALEAYHSPSSDQAPLRIVLLQDLNTTVCGSSIYSAQCFDGVNLRSETQDLLSNIPQGDGLLRLNRLLLEDAYSLELSSNQLPGFAHYNRECLDKKIVKRLPCWRDFWKIIKWLPSWGGIFTVVAFILWSTLIVCSILLSRSLSRTKSDDSLFGQVTDSRTGRPIVGATVAVTNSSKIARNFTTDAAGHFGVCSPPTGPATDTTDKTGHAHASPLPTLAPGTNAQNQVLVPKKSPQPAATVPTK